MEIKLPQPKRVDLELTEHGDIELTEEECAAFAQAMIDNVKNAVSATVDKFNGSVEDFLTAGVGEHTDGIENAIAEMFDRMNSLTERSLSMLLDALNTMGEDMGEDAGEDSPSNDQIPLPIEEPTDTKQKIATAVTQQIIRNVGGRQLLITDKDYRNALTPNENSRAYISMLKGGLWENLEVTGDGRIALKETGAVEDMGGEIREGLARAADVDIPLLSQLVTAAFRSHTEFGKDEVTVSVPSFFREMGVDIRKPKKGKTAPKSNDVWHKIKSFEDCVGVTDNGSLYKVFSFKEYDAEENTLTFTIPYFTKVLLPALDQKNKRPIARGENKLIHNPYLSWLVHADIVSERNKRAVAIVYYIVTSLQERGGTPDSGLKKNANKKNSTNRVSVRMKYSTIINSVPGFNEMLEESSPANRNGQIKRAFVRAFELLKEKTDLYQYYLELNIPDTIPTYPTINGLLVITHNGINGDYRPR